jgi:hypothetical protein
MSERQWSFYVGFFAKFRGGESTEVSLLHFDTVDIRRN